MSSPIVEEKVLRLNEDGSYDEYRDLYDTEYASKRTFFKREKTGLRWAEAETVSYADADNNPELIMHGFFVYDPVTNSFKRFKRA